MILPPINQGRNMSQFLALEDSSTTFKLLDNLNLAINEARLVRRIMNMSNQAGNIESTSGPSIRTQRLREVVKELENQLAIVRSHQTQANHEQDSF
jgi:uncharacterized protein YjgD (DUF1641 family)